MDSLPILIFDYDGTLHETLLIYELAIREAVGWLRRDYGIEVEMPSRDRMRSWLGMNVEEMWADFHPTFGKDLQDLAARRIGATMQQAAISGKSNWYEGMDEALEELRQCGYRMTVLSNCETSYAKLHWKLFHMDRYFDAFLDCESRGHASKADILRSIKNDYRKAVISAPVHRTDLAGIENGKNFIMIGDRISDRLAAQDSEIPFIGCRYGYGSDRELEGADRTVGRPTEIPQRVRELQKDKKLGEY